MQADLTVCGSVKRDLFTWQKRPLEICIPQVCASVKRDLYICRKRPIPISIPQVSTVLLLASMLVLGSLCMDCMACVCVVCVCVCVCVFLVFMCMCVCVCVRARERVRACFFTALSPRSPLSPPLREFVRE